jgi:hypothetical protein
LEEVAREKEIAADAIEIWIADETRVGQKNKITPSLGPPWQPARSA